MKKRVQAFGFALTGLRTFFAESIHARIHLAAAVGVILAGYITGLSPVEWIIIFLCIGLVMALEAVNSAIEYLTDLASPEWHPLAKKTKDVAAGAVLISAMISVIIALIIFIPKIG